MSCTHCKSINTMYQLCCYKHHFMYDQSHVVYILNDKSVELQTAE